ncbi:MAG: LysM peptidoglycan-binding domain-containing protein [Nocardioides sp.]
MSTMTIDQMMSSQSVRHPAARSQVRLTRRGRLVVLLACLAVVLLLGVVWGAGSVATEQPGTPEPTQTVQVGPGDTLYAIAAEATTDGDVAAMVERIQDLNSLDSGMVVIGQDLRVPVE